MSYDISLLDPITGQTLQLDQPHYMRGGTYAMGGTKDLQLNITYNYSKYFKSLGYEGIRSIYGMTGAESIPLLEKVISSLGDNVSDNYWDATEGNAKRALLQLKAMATMRPEGVWDGD